MNIKDFILKTYFNKERNDFMIKQAAIESAKDQDNILKQSNEITRSR